MQVLLELAREMRKDPEFGPLIVDEPEMLGVDAFAESAVVIEIPFPHRTVYHRSVDGPIAVELSSDSGGPRGGRPDESE